MLAAYLPRPSLDSTHHHRPRTLPVPGFERVFLLRDPAQANGIAEAAADKKVVLI